MSFVLITPGREIPLSGTVEAFSKDGALIKLDLLINEYASALQEYLTRLPEAEAKGKFDFKANSAQPIPDKQS